METFLAVIGWSLFGLAIMTGLALDLVGLFGNWIILVAVACAWALTGFEHFGIWAIAAMAGLAVLGEVLETATAGYGARKSGGSKGSMVAAIVGCLAGAVVGTPWFPVVGTIAGACLGAFIGATSYEYLMMERSVSDAARTGLGAAMGKVAGMLAKVLIGLIMLAVAVWTYSG